LANRRTQRKTKDEETCYSITKPKDGGRGETKKKKKEPGGAKIVDGRTRGLAHGFEPVLGGYRKTLRQPWVHTKREKIKEGSK